MVHGHDVYYILYYVYLVGCPTDLKTCSGDGLQGMYYMYGISLTKAWFICNAKAIVLALKEN